MRVKAIHKNEVLKPLEKLGQKEGEKTEIDISNTVRRTRGIIKINNKLIKEIAESDELSVTIIH